MLGWIKFFLHASIETAKAAKMKFKNAVEQVNKYNLYLINKKNNAASLQHILHVMYCQPVATSEQLSKLTGLAVQTINKMVKDFMCGWYFGRSYRK